MFFVMVIHHMNGHKIICIIKNIDIYKHKNVKHLFSNEIISINYVNSKENIVDPLTKSLLRKLVYSSSRAIGLKPLKYERV